MPERTTQAASANQPADLLPWADPYIVQLFRELAQTDEMTSGTDTVVSEGEKATAQAVFAGRTWSITPLRPAGSRTRRTGSEHRMACC